MNAIVVWSPGFLHEVVDANGPMSALLSVVNKINSTVPEDVNTIGMCVVYEDNGEITSLKVTCDTKNLLNLRREIENLPLILAIGEEKSNSLQLGRHVKSLKDAIRIVRRQPAHDGDRYRLFREVDDALVEYENLDTGASFDLEVESIIYDDLFDEEAKSHGRDNYRLC